MKKVIRRHAYYIASAAFIISWIVYFVATIDKPYVGLNLKNVNEKWIVLFSDPHGEGYKSGIRVGDQVLKINNDDTGNYHFVQKWNQVQGAKTLEVRRNNQPSDEVIKIPESSVLFEALSGIPMAILGLIFWLLGFVTWYRRSFLVQARAIFWLNFSIGLAIVLAPASSRGLLFARELEYIILSSVPALLTNFFSVFPHENFNRINRSGRLLFALMSVIISILTVLQSFGIIPFESLLRKLLYSTFIIGILFALWNLVTLIKLPKNSAEKNQASIVLMGIAIGFLPFVLLTMVPQLFNFQPIVYAEVSSLALCVIPTSLYYVIVNKYLPDSRRLLRTTFSFFFAGVIISMVISYALFRLKIVTTLNHDVYLSSLSLTIVSISCFSYLRGQICKLLDRFIFLEGKQDFKQRILKLNESCINNEDQVLIEAVKMLAIEGAYIIENNGKGESFKKAVGRSFRKPSVQAKLEDFYQVDKKINLDIQLLPHDFPAEVYIPFVSPDFSCGIFLGHRYSQIKFELDELPFITLISSQLGQSLRMALATKNLSREIKFLAQRSLDSQLRNHGHQGITSSLFRNLEKEKKLLAREIHDGPLQLGLDLNRRLKFFFEEFPTDDKNAKVISYMQELTEDLNFELRLICNDLRPPSLTDLGLLSAIELMCEETMLNELLTISIDTVGIGREQRFNEEVELAAYRFLQEGITNAVKHSACTQLNILIVMSKDRLELTISDSGKGFDASRIADWSLSGTHFGIAGMKERIDGLGGDLQISSTIGQGVILKANIPIIERN